MPDDYYERNKAFMREDATNFNTDLGGKEPEFQAWVKQNKVPFDPAAETADYDMRGFYKALQDGDPKAQEAINLNDNKMHFPDYWKTPYHQSFSAESQWADPDKAPSWNSKDQLVMPDGTVVFDERAEAAARALQKQQDNIQKVQQLKMLLQKVLKPQTGAVPMQQGGG